jgi:hypothetical protein
MKHEREPLPRDLIAAIQRTANNAILAGCDAVETIALVTATIEWWKAANDGAFRRWCAAASRIQ